MYSTVYVYLPLYIERIYSILNSPKKKGMGEKRKSKRREKEKRKGKERKEGEENGREREENT